MREVKNMTPLIEQYRAYKKQEEAFEEAIRVASALAEEESKRRGVRGEVSVETEIIRHTSHAKSGAEIDLGTIVMARASGSLA